MKKLILTALILVNGFTLFSQSSFQLPDFSVECNTDFWTITVDGYIQQWHLSSGIISGGDTVLSGGGLSLAYCGDGDSPTFYTDNWSPGEIGINYYDQDSGWVNLPTDVHVQNNGGHLDDQYFTVVGGVIQYVNYWDGTNLFVIDSLHGEFFAGIFDIGVDTSGHAWIFTASMPGTTVDSLKVYDQSGKINSYSCDFNIEGYGSFFLNDTLYLGTLKGSIFPVIISGNTAQLEIGIPFPSNNFTDMASCQVAGSTLSADSPKPEFKLFPNPTADYIRLPIDVNRSTISLYNSQGKPIELKLDGNLLDLTEHASGMYYIKIDSEGWTGCYKVMKF